MAITSESDFVKSLGTLALGSRLRRLLDRLNTDVSRFYRLLGVEFEAPWFPVLYLLGRQAPMTITGIATTIGFTHPAINKIVASMDKAGLVVSSRYANDKRKRLVDLSAGGRDLYRTLSPVWDNAQEVMADLVAVAGENLLESLDRLEERLDRRSVYSRLAGKMKPQLMERVEIVEYTDGLRKHFRSLNHDWLRRQHHIDKHDEEQLLDPRKVIVDTGGAVIFARLDGRIVGTCALLRHNNRLFELCKMAVAETDRGRFVGSRLAVAAIDSARRMGADTIVAETDPENVRAIRLGESFGFRRSARHILPARYTRPRLSLVLDLTESGT
jgi:DNA-binding MarR family transcriptional regulator/GNAT superfamily N-acetyltransferase